MTSQSPASRSVSTTFTPNQAIFIAGWPNVRQSPGYVNQPSDDVIGMAVPGTPATVTDGPHAQDNLIWWQVKTSLGDGSAVTGWVAERDPEGTVLLSAEAPETAASDEPTPSPTKTLGDLLKESGDSGDATASLYSGTVYAAGTTVYNCCGEPVNIRQSAGLAGDASNLLTMIPAGTALTVEGGPQLVDELVWWMVSCQDGDGKSVTGWVAEATSAGVRLISTSLPGFSTHNNSGPIPEIAPAGLRLAKPFEGNFAVSQWWGGNRSFYQDFFYDGVPLLGHNGIDFATWIGTPLTAVDEGQVIKVDYEHGGFGHHILVRHSWGESLYAHLNTVGVLHGTHVTRGQQIGTTGDSGAGAAHLHFGIRLNPYRRTDGWGGFTDPRPFMDPAHLVASRSPHAPVPMAKEIPGRPRP